MSESAAALVRTIAAVAGPDARPREDQVRAVEELLEHRRRVLVAQATGWGKSAVYWAATTALRELGKGPTLVVSPLLALMRDQIAAPFRAGLRAATINSTNVDEWSGVLDDLRSGRLDGGALVGELAAAGRRGGHAVAAVPAPGRLPRRAGGPGRPAATGRRAGREPTAADGRGGLSGPGTGLAGPHRRTRRGELRRAGAAGG